MRRSRSGQKNDALSFRYAKVPAGNKTARKKGLWDFIRRFAARRGQFTLDELGQFINRIQARQNCVSMVREGQLERVRKGTGGRYSRTTAVYRSKARPPAQKSLTLYRHD